MVDISLTVCAQEEDFEILDIILNYSKRFHTTLYYSSSKNVFELLRNVPFNLNL